MFSKIDILENQGLGERYYKWEVYSTETVFQHRWERSPVEIESVPRGYVFPRTNQSVSSKGYAIWNESNRAVVKSRVKFDRISASYAEITIPTEEEIVYDEEVGSDVKRITMLHAWVPYNIFLEQLRKDDSGTLHILTEEWLKNKAEIYEYYTYITVDTEYVREPNVKVVFKRPIMRSYYKTPRAVGEPIEPPEIITQRVNIDTLSIFYKALTLEEASSMSESSTYIHPIVRLSRTRDTLYGGLEVHSSDKGASWTQSDFERYQNRMIESVKKNFKGYTGFGKTYKSIVLDDGSIADEVFLTLGLYDENFYFRWVQRNGEWYYQIEFTLAYISPDSAQHRVSYMPNSNLPWYSYGTIFNYHWDDPEIYTIFSAEWNYFQQAYSFYDYHYVDLLDITDSIGPVWGRIGENQFSSAGVGQSDFELPQYQSDDPAWLKWRIAGLYEMNKLPAYHYFHFTNVGKRYIGHTHEGWADDQEYYYYDINANTANYSERYLLGFELYFWKQPIFSGYKSGWANAVYSDPGSQFYHWDKNIDSIDYYPELDVVERFNNGQLIKHTFPTTAQIVDDAYNIRDFNEIQINLTNYSDFDATVSVFENYDHLIGIDTEHKEIVKSFSPNTYPKDSIQNGWKYTYLGEVAIGNSSTGRQIGTRISNNINAYPRDGVQATPTGAGVEYYHYTFVGLTRNTIETYFPDVIFNCVSRQSLGSSNSFSIGNVAGGTVEFEVLRPYVEVVQYKGNDINVYYTYNDESGDHYYIDGQYKIREIEEIGPSRTKVVAYDNCYKLDTSAMPLLEHINRSTLVKKLFYYVCAYCDIPYYGNEIILNGDVETGNLKDIDKNTTCRELVEWVAQISGTVAVCDPQGFLTLKTLEKPPRSRGSWQKQNRNLRVSKIPIVVPVGIKIETLDGQEVIGELTEWENRIIDWTNNEIIKHNSQLPMEISIQQVLDNFSLIEDVYSFECDIADNRYGISCGDSWVVEGDNIEPRRGIITDKSVGGSGVQLTSSAGIESEYAPFYSKEEATINLLINEVDAFFTSIELDGIQTVDPYSGEVIEQIDEHYNLLLEDAIVSYNGKLIDLSPQWRSLVVLPEEWVEIAVGLDTYKVRIVNGYLQIYNIDTIPEAFTQFNVYWIRWWEPNDAVDMPATFLKSLTVQETMGNEIDLSMEQVLNCFNQGETVYVSNPQPFKVIFPMAIGKYLYKLYNSPRSHVPLYYQPSTYGNYYSFEGTNYDNYGVWKPEYIEAIRVEGAYFYDLEIAVSAGKVLFYVKSQKLEAQNANGRMIPNWPTEAYEIGAYYRYTDTSGNRYAAPLIDSNKEPYPTTIGVLDRTLGIKQNGKQITDGFVYQYLPLYRENIVNGESFPVMEDFVGFLVQKGTFLSHPTRPTERDQYGRLPEDPWTPASFSLEWAFIPYNPQQNQGYNIAAKEFFFNTTEETFRYTNYLDDGEEHSAFIMTVSFNAHDIPEVKNVVLIGDTAYSVAGTNTQVLDSEMPFDIYNTPITNLKTGTTEVPQWSLDNDYINRCFGTITGNLGVVINGKFDEPEEVDWDFSEDMYNQLIYLYYGPRRITNFAFKYFDEGFVITTTGVSADWYFEPVSQTLLIGNL